MLLQYLRIIVQITVICCVAVVCVASVCFTILVFTSPGAAFDAWQRPQPLTAYWSALFSIGPRELSPDLKADKNTLQQMEDWVKHCVNSRGGNFDKDGDLYRPEAGVLTLMDAINSQLFLLRTRADSAHRFWETTSIISIILGMLTTVVVSLSSTVFGRSEGHSPLVLRIIAVILPAVGTAVTALITFYGPQAEWTQATRTLANIRQLEGNIQLDAWKLKCMVQEDDEMGQKIMTRVEDWTKRYVDILTVANAAGAGAGDGASAGSQAGSASRHR